MVTILEGFMSVDNQYLQMQILNHIQQCENFMNTCKLSTLKDDGVVDKAERKILKTIEKETNSYIEHLKKL